MTPIADYKHPIWKDREYVQAQRLRRRWRMLFRSMAFLGGSLGVVAVIALVAS